MQASSFKQVTLCRWSVIEENCDSRTNLRLSPNGVITFFTGVANTWQRIQGRKEGRKERLLVQYKSRVHHGKEGTAQELGHIASSQGAEKVSVGTQLTSALTVSYSRTLDRGMVASTSGWIFGFQLTQSRNSPTDMPHWSSILAITSPPSVNLKPKHAVFSHNFYPLSP